MQPQLLKQVVNNMKNLLNYLPNWKTIKIFLNVIYNVGFIFWFLSRIYVIAFKPVGSSAAVITNDDIFIALIFIAFFVLDIKEVVVNKKN
jgi:hypothetical protein